MGEPGGLPSQGSHSVGHDWSDLAAAAAPAAVLIYHFRKKKESNYKLSNYDKIQNYMDLVNSSQPYTDCYILKIFLLKRIW